MRGNLSSTAFSYLHLPAASASFPCSAFPHLRPAPQSVATIDGSKQEGARGEAEALLARHGFLLRLSDEVDVVRLHDDDIMMMFDDIMLMT